VLPARRSGMPLALAPIPYPRAHLPSRESGAKGLPRLPPAIPALHFLVVAVRILLNTPHHIEPVEGVTKIIIIPNRVGVVGEDSKDLFDGKLISRINFRLERGTATICHMNNVEHLNSCVWLSEEGFSPSPL